MTPLEELIAAAFDSGQIYEHSSQQGSAEDMDHDFEWFLETKKAFIEKCFRDELSRRRKSNTKQNNQDDTVS